MTTMSMATDARPRDGDLLPTHADEIVARRHGEEVSKMHGKGAGKHRLGAEICLRAAGGLLNQRDAIVRRAR